MWKIPPPLQNADTWNWQTKCQPIRVHSTWVPVKRNFPAAVLRILTNVVATLFGNSLAIIAKLAVKKDALPIASIILMVKLRIINGYRPSMLSRSLKTFSIWHHIICYIITDLYYIDWKWVFLIMKLTVASFVYIFVYIFPILLVLRLSLFTLLMKRSYSTVKTLRNKTGI